MTGVAPVQGHPEGGARIGYGERTKVAGMLVELLYTSAEAREMTDDSLLELLETSRRNNPRLGITGLLVFHAGSFMQLLEGEEETVMRLYQKILQDDRHTQSRVLWKGPIKQRTFGDWTMAFQKLGDVDPARLEGYSRFLEEGFAGDYAGGNASVAQSLMHMLSDTLER